MTYNVSTKIIMVLILYVLLDFEDIFSSKITLIVALLNTGVIESAVHILTYFPLGCIYSRPRPETPRHIHTIKMCRKREEE